MLHQTLPDSQPFEVYKPSLPPPKVSDRISLPRAPRVKPLPGIRAPKILPSTAATATEIDDSGWPFDQRETATPLRAMAVKKASHVLELLRFAMVGFVGGPWSCQLTSNRDLCEVSTHSVHPVGFCWKQARPPKVARGPGIEHAVPALCLFPGDLHRCVKLLVVPTLALCG